MNKTAKSLLEQIEEYLVNESTDLLSYDEAHDQENWDIPAESNLDELLMNLETEGKLVRRGDYYEVLGLALQKMHDAEEMQNGGWKD